MSKKTDWPFISSTLESMVLHTGTRQSLNPVWTFKASALSSITCMKGIIGSTYSARGPAIGRNLFLPALHRLTFWITKICYQLLKGSRLRPAMKAGRSNVIGNMFMGSSAFEWISWKLVRMGCCVPQSFVLHSSEQLELKLLSKADLCCISWSKVEITHFFPRAVLFKGQELLAVTLFREALGIKFMSYARCTRDLALPVYGDRVKDGC